MLGRINAKGMACQGACQPRPCCNLLSTTPGKPLGDWKLVSAFGATNADCIPIDSSPPSYTDTPLRSGPYWLLIFQATQILPFTWFCLWITWLRTEGDAQCDGYLYRGPCLDVGAKFQLKLSYGKPTWKLINLKISSRERHPPEGTGHIRTFLMKWSLVYFSVVEVIACDISLNHLFIFFLLFSA